MKEFVGESYSKAVAKNGDATYVSEMGTQFLYCINNYAKKIRTPSRVMCLGIRMFYWTRIQSDFAGC